MIDVLNEYWPLLLAIVILGLLIGLWLLRPKQRVSLSDSGPVRPHMMAAVRDGPEGNGLTDEAAAATSDIAGELLDAPVHASLAAAAGGGDDLQRLKGVGPRLVALLHERGIFRYHQLAGMTDAELDLLDQSLGSFKGRLRRDRVRDQAGYLARGDVEAYEREFGKLST